MHNKINMEIREAKPEEYPSIVNFQLSMASETENIELDKPTVDKGVKAVLADGSKGKYYVALEKGQIVGSLLTTYEWSDWRNGTILWIQSVYVLPTYRRKGVYRSLYTHLKNKVNQSEELNGIRLYADKSNIAAHKTYRKLAMADDHYLTFEWMK